MTEPTSARVPSSTYRLQLGPHLRFADAEALVPYLEALGVGACYVSPILAARPGSPHGYDVVDHTRLNPELGTREEFERFARAVAARGMGLIVDVVPNHMAVDPASNPRWRDVLTYGPRAASADWFDIDWQPVTRALDGKVLLPILGDQYGLVLERGELRVSREADGAHLRYFEHDLPIDPATLPETGDLAALNGTPGDASSFDALHALLERQAYRLAYWRTAFDEINYRRFFDINELGAIRMEEPAVFDEAHRLVLEFVRAGLVTGLRLDHPDGLADPAAYFRQVQAAVAAVGSDLDSCVPVRTNQDLTPLYLAAEKIVSAGERFPADWAIHGGTGYRFLNTVNGLLVDRAGLHTLERLWQRLSGNAASFDEIAYECRRLIARSAMASEMNVLAHALERIAKRDRRSRDFTLNSLRKVLREVVASFPVYRTYVSPRGVSDTDRDVVAAALDGARRRSPVMERSIFDFVRRVLLGEGPDGAPDPERLRVAMRFQQITGPIQAKGLEDTAFYRYVPLLSVNEVGSHPESPTVSVAEFHDQTMARAADWPATMLALSTHDTKRSADARARLAVLSEIPDEWRRTVTGWMRINARVRAPLAGRPGPDRADEYHYYQALLAIWPPEPADAPVPRTAPPAIEARVADYMVKAVREAKLRSSWLRPDDAYEQELRTFVADTLTGPGARSFLRRFVPFARRLARAGAVNALAQLVLQIGSPGVPDVYQGSELWQHQLVDPDNRGPVDFTARRAALDALHSGIQAARSGVGAEGVEAVVRALVDAWPDGRVKLWTLAATLGDRRRHPEVFVGGDYEPLAADPSDAPIVAFARRAGGRVVVVAAARQAARLAGDGWPVGEAWGHARLSLPRVANGAWRDVLTGRPLTVMSDGSIGIGDLFTVLPVAWAVAGPA